MPSLSENTRWYAFITFEPQLSQVFMVSPLGVGGGGGLVGRYRPLVRSSFNSSTARSTSDENSRNSSTDTKDRFSVETLPP